MQLKREGKLGKSKSNDKADMIEDDEEDITMDTAESSKVAPSDEISPEYTLLEKLRRSRVMEGKSTQFTRQYQEKLKQKLSRQNAVDDTGESDEGDADNDDSDDEENDAATISLVAQKWEEKIAQASSKKADDVNFVKEMDAKEQELNQLYGYRQEREGQEKSVVSSDGEDTPKSTSGVGGSWKASSSPEGIEIYKPTRGSWGAFPRPKDISKAYGGGRRVGAGYTSEDSVRKSEEETRAKLRAYREKVGIVVQSEIDHADEIEEALMLSSRAMLVSRRCEPRIYL